MENNEEQSEAIQKNFYKQRAYHTSNFTIIHNEILFIKDENNKPMDLETLGLFWRLMSLPKNWSLNIKGLASISGCCINKIQNHLDKLKSMGYVVMYQTKTEDGKFGKTYYKLNETIDSNLWQNIEESNTEMIDISNEEINNPLSNETIDNKESYPYFSYSNMGNKNMEEQNMEEQNMENQYIYKINNNKVNNDIVSNNKGFSINKKEDLQSSFSKNSFSSLNINKSTKGTLVEELTEYGPPNSYENQVDFSKDEDTKLLRNIKKKSSKKDNRLPISEILTEKIGDNTDMQNEIARCKKQINELSEKSKEQERKVGKNLGKKKRLLNHIESNFSTQPEIMSALKDFAEMYMERKNVLTTASFDLLVKDLYAITTDPKEMLNVINNSIKKSYLGFYPESNSKPTGNCFSNGKIVKPIIDISGTSTSVKSEAGGVKSNDEINPEDIFKSLKNKRMY